MNDFYDQTTTGIESDITKAERYAVDQHLEEAPVKDSIGQQVEAVAKESFVGAAGFRYADKLADNIYEQEGWELDDETLMDINRNYNEKESKYLRESNSQEAFLKRQADIEYERNMDNTLARMGIVKSMSSVMAMSMLDPATWMSLGSTFAYTGARQVGRAAKILTGAGVVGLENALAESVFYAANTQSRPMDIVLAAGFGSVVGGGVGWLAREKKPNLAAHADDADASIRADLEEFVLRDAEAELVKTGKVRSDIADIVGPDGDGLKVQSDIRQMDATIKAELELKLKPKEVDDILEELAFIETRRTEISKVTDVDPAVKSTPTEEMLADLNVETRELDAKARELEAKLDGHTRATEAAKFKNKWKKWSTKKKIERLYEGKAIPNKRLAGESQRSTAIEVERSAMPGQRSDITPETREQVMAEARRDPDFAKKIDEEMASVESLKVKVKQDIEDRFGCEVIL